MPDRAEAGASLQEIGELLIRLAHEKVFGEVVLTLKHGQIVQVRLHQVLKPGELATRGHPQP